ncbi:hypothetical protein AbraIFM66950_010806 [Aspergillus brasiliensis]|nr:hypothetical protein AbraIFM66950_010806 [Aspergillus brasiliensis]
MAHKIAVALPQLAKMIDHSLLHPHNDRRRPHRRLSKSRAITTSQLPASSLCPVIGFPHGNSTTEVKVLEASAAAKAWGAAKIDMVVNVGKVSGGVGG